jgi:hypothetical protein
MSDPTEPDEHARGQMIFAQTTSVAWIALGWNTIDHAAEAILGLALKIPIEMFADLGSRLSFENRADLIRHRLRVGFKGSDPIVDMVSDTLGAAATCKTHRHNIIHARADFDAMIGKTSKHRGRVLQVDMSPDGLKRVAEYIDVTADEMIAVMGIIRCVANRNDKNVADSERKQLEEELPALLEELKTLQTTRKAMKPLPSIEG